MKIQHGDQLCVSCLKVHIRVQKLYRNTCVVFSIGVFCFTYRLVKSKHNGIFNSSLLLLKLQLISFWLFVL
jgi:hypothetical protein